MYYQVLTTNGKEWIYATALKSVKSLKGLVYIVSVTADEPNDIVRVLN